MSKPHLLECLFYSNEYNIAMDILRCSNIEQLRPMPFHLLYALLWDTERLIRIEFFLWNHANYF